MIDGRDDIILVWLTRELVIAVRGLLYIFKDVT